MEHLFMEHLFIKDIIDYNLFNNTPSIITNNLFNYYDTKEIIVPFDNNNDNNEEFEVINIEKEKSHDIINYLNDINKEKARVLKVLEFLIVNIDINKLELPNYKKPSNYDDVPKYLKNKIRKHPNNPFDINKFFLKNNLKKDEIIKMLEDMSDDFQSRITNSEQMWQNKESHAKIIGYLEGSIHNKIYELLNERFTKNINIYDYLKEKIIEKCKNNEILKDFLISNIKYFFKLYQSCAHWHEATYQFLPLRLSSSHAASRCFNTTTTHQIRKALMNSLKYSP